MDALINSGQALLEQFNDIVHNLFVAIFGPWAGLAELVFVMVVIVKWVWQSKWV